jgi:hypothetical protein
MANAVTDLGRPDEIGKVSTGFQKYPYERARDRFCRGPYKIALR